MSLVPLTKKKKVRYYEAVTNAAIHMQIGNVI
jgi:hypothetical protein